MKSSDFISQMEVLLKPKGASCKRVLAKTKDGEGCTIKHPDVGSFCLVGAMNRVAMTGPPGVVYKTYGRVQDRFAAEGVSCISYWNDALFRTKWSVMRKLAKVKQRALREGD